MDIQIGWQVSGQQDNRLADTHVYIYICLFASMPIYLSYRAYHIYSIVYTMICMDIYNEVLACIRSAGIRSTGRHVNVDLYNWLFADLLTGLIMYT